MTEAEWLAAADSAPMLDFLRDRGGASDRKPRLFACACCRRVWHRLKQASGRGAVEATERYADGGVAVREWAVARDAASEITLAHAWSGDDYAHRAALSAASASAWEATAPPPPRASRWRW